MGWQRQMTVPADIRIHFIGDSFVNGTGDETALARGLDLAISGTIERRSPGKDNATSKRRVSGVEFAG